MAKQVVLVSVLAVCITLCWVAFILRPRAPEKNFSLLKKDVIETASSLEIPFATKAGRPTGFCRSFLENLDKLQLDWRTYTPRPGPIAQAYMAMVSQNCDPILGAEEDAIRDPRIAGIMEFYRLKACLHLSTETNVFLLLVQELEREEADSRR